VFKCPSCGTVWDRDRAAVVNLVLRYLRGLYKEECQDADCAMRLADAMQAWLKRHTWLPAALAPRSRGGGGPPSRPVPRRGPARGPTLLDGGGHAVRGSGAGRGVVLVNAPGAAVRGLAVSGFEYGIVANGSPGCRVAENRVVGGRVGIGLWSSPNCSVEGNAVEKAWSGSSWRARAAPRSPGTS